MRARPHAGVHGLWHGDDGRPVHTNSGVELHRDLLRLQLEHGARGRARRASEHVMHLVDLCRGDERAYGRAWLAWLAWHKQHMMEVCSAVRAVQEVGDARQQLLCGNYVRKQFCHAGTY